MRTQHTFQQNIARWGRLHPKEAVALQYLDPKGLDICFTKSGELNLKSKVEGQWVYHHSNASAKDDSLKWFNSLNLDNAEVFCIYGVGLGYDYLAAKAWLKKKKSRALVFFEDDLRVIFYLLQTDIGKDILKDSQVWLYAFENIKESSDCIREMFWQFMSTKIAVYPSKHYEKTRPNTFAELKHKIAYDIHMDSLTLSEYLDFGVHFFKNYYQNLLLLPGSYLAPRLFGKFAQMPAIICGAGPSLKKNLPLLKTLKDKAIIFAGGSALNALTSAGMTPHFGAGIDPNPEQYKRLKQTSGAKVPFFYRNRIYHPAFQTVQGPRLYIPGSCGYDISKWFDTKLGLIKDKEEKTLDEGHNIVTFLVNIAASLGCNPIIFTGMDLGFTDMETYAPGIVENPKVNEEQIFLQDQENIPLLKTDIHGNPFYTLWKWIAESEWISDFAKNHPEIGFVNATEGGLGFENIINLSLEESVKTHLLNSQDIQQLVDNEIEKCKMPWVTKSAVESLAEQMLSSLLCCAQSLQNLIDENKKAETEIAKEKSVKPMPSGLSALYETELLDEIGYAYVLEIFNAIQARVLNRELMRLKTSRLPDWKKHLKKLKIERKKLIFLLQTCLINIELIKQAMKTKTS